VAVNYPVSIDAFNEPTLPEATPLSEAGTGTRNHVEHHHDIGQAVVQLETNAAQLTHDHSGGSALFHTSKLVQANTHQSPDTDASTTGLHHTLGLGSTQAAAGDHIHDYTGNTIINKPIEICTSTGRPAPFPGKMIWEVDTNRMRVWAQFPGQDTAIQGLYSTDSFTRTSTANLGTALWNQTYLPFTDGLHGKMATSSGNSANWIPQGSAANRCIARRINAADKHTQTYDQVITFNTNEHVMEWVNASPANPTVNDAYFRMSDDGQTYVRAALTWWKGSTGTVMLIYTTTGPGGEQLLGQLPAKSDTPNILWQFRLVGTKFEVYMGIEYVGAIIDNQGVTNTGFKGWGFGMQGGDGGFAQDVPNEISAITIADATYFTSSAIWQLLPVGDVPKVGLGTSVPQSINPTGSVIEWDIVGEDNFGFYNPALKTAVVVTEPGIYFVHASICWGNNLFGDHAATVVMVNDQPTMHMHWEFLRGFDFTPGFSQTVDVSAYVRLDTNDRIGIAAAHNGASAQFTGHKKSDQITQMSRFFLTFHSA
jgi:hypothetical protein